MNITQQQHDELFELIEDSVEFFCSENMVSGECVYTIIESIAQAKLAQMSGVCN